MCDARRGTRAMGGVGGGEEQPVRAENATQGIIDKVWGWSSRSCTPLEQEAVIRLPRAVGEEGIEQCLSVVKYEGRTAMFTTYHLECTAPLAAGKEITVYTGQGRPTIVSLSHLAAQTKKARRQQHRSALY